MMNTFVHVVLALLAVDLIAFAVDSGLHLEGAAHLMLFAGSGGLAYIIGSSWAAAGDPS